MDHDAVSRVCEARVGVALGGSWTLAELMGVGGTTALYRASGPSGGRVAVKCLHPHLAVDPELRARFLREAYVANDVEHVGSVKVLGDGLTDQGEAYLVVELLKGASVKDHALRHSGRLPVKLVLRVLDQLLSVLEKAHAAGILHREIKPEHVFLTEEGVVKLLDFGIARLAEGLGATKPGPGMLASAPAFMAPEQALGHGDQVDARTDLWAVGATVFSLLTGREVHVAASAAELLVAAATRKAPSLADVVEASRPLVEFVDAALAFERAHRFPSATAMRRVLRTTVTELRAPRSSIQPAPSRTPSPQPVVSRGASSARATNDLPTGEPSCRDQHATGEMANQGGWQLEAPIGKHIPVLSPLPTRTHGWVAGAERRQTVRCSRGSPGAAPDAADGGDSGSVVPQTPDGMGEPVMASAEPGSVADATHSEAEIEALRGLFKSFESVLTAQLRLTRNDADGNEQLDQPFRSVESLLAVCGGFLVWQVTPCAFAVGHSALWEPEAPFDRVVHQLYSDGIRSLGIGPGLTREELDEFLRIISFDRTTEMAPEDDHVTMLWDACLEHVSCNSVDTFALGNEESRARFEHDAERVVQLARFDTGQQLEDHWAEHEGAERNLPVEPLLRRLGVLLDGPSGAGREPPAWEAEVETSDARLHESLIEATMSVEPAVIQGLAASMSPAEVTLGNDFAIASVHALRAALELGNAESVVSVLRFAVEGLAQDAPVQALDLVNALACAAAGLDRGTESNGVRGEIAGSIVSTESRELILKEALASDADQDCLAEGLRALLDSADDTLVGIALSAFVSAQSEGVKAVLLSYLRRTVRGHELELGRELATVDVEPGLALVRLLVKVDSGEARAALGMAAQSRHDVVRIEALSHVEGGPSERLRAELRALLEHESLEARLAVLRSIADHGLRAAGPMLVLRIRDEGFDGLSREERGAILRAVSVLAPSRAESLALELLMEGRVVSSEAHEQTRGLAAEMLGRIAASREALAALHEAATKRWRNSERVRTVAGEALKQVERRHSLAPDSPTAQPLAIAAVGSSYGRELGREAALSGYLARSTASHGARPAIAEICQRGGLGGDSDAPIEERVLRFYAVALVTLRTFYDSVADGADSVALHLVKRLAQRLVSLSERGSAAMLGMGALAHVHRDDAGRALQVAIHSLIVARQITRDRRVLSQLAMTALVAESGRTRRSGTAQPGEQRTPRMLQPASVPAMTAAVCLRSGGVNATNALRTTVAFETAWLERQALMGAPPFGGRAPLPQSELLCAVRRLLDLRAPRDEAASPLSPIAALVELARERTVDATVLRILVRAIGLPPAGTVVELDTGEWGVLVGPAWDDQQPHRGRIRLVVDSRGRSLCPCPEIDLGVHTGSGQPRRMKYVVDTELARFNVARAFVFAPRLG